MTPKFYNNLKKWRSKKIVGIIVFDFVSATLIGVAIGFYWYMLQWYGGFQTFSKDGEDTKGRVG